MNAAPIQSIAPTHPQQARSAPRPGPSFEAQLRAAGKEREIRQARTAMQQFVSATFVEPLLSQLRSTSQAEGPFAPGDAERRFGPLLDQHLADRMTASGNFPLVDRLEEHIFSVMIRRLPLEQDGAVKDSPHART